MLEARIQQQFFEGADLHYQAAETLARPIAQAAQALVGALTAGGKILVASLDDGDVLARHFAGVLVGGFERERPPLACVALTGDDDARLAQLRALGLPGDVLLVLAQGGEAAQAAVPRDDDRPPPQALRGLAEAAHAQELTLVGVVGHGGASLKPALTETDVLVPVPHERLARVTEVQLLVLHCLADAVDIQLMGESES